MDIFWFYYLSCFVYCIIVSVRGWRKNSMTGGLSISPDLDILVFLFLCWFLAPIDFFLTWLRLYKEAEKVRINHSKIS